MGGCYIYINYCWQQCNILIKFGWFGFEVLDNKILFLVSVQSSKSKLLIFIYFEFESLSLNEILSASNWNIVIILKMSL